MCSVLYNKLAKCAQNLYARIINRLTVLSKPNTISEAETGCFFLLGYLGQITNYLRFSDRKAFQREIAEHFRCDTYFTNQTCILYLVLLSELSWTSTLMSWHGSDQISQNNTQEYIIEPLQTEKARTFVFTFQIVVFATTVQQTGQDW